MEETFKRIPPEDVFITVFKRKPTEEELWMGVPPDFDGNRPSGNNLIDLFAYRGVSMIVFSIWKSARRLWYFSSSREVSISVSK